MSPSTVTSVRFPIDRVVACTMNHFRRIYRNRPLFSPNQSVNRSQRAVCIALRDRKIEKKRENLLVAIVELHVGVTTCIFHHIILHLLDTIFLHYFQRLNRFCMAAQANPHANQTSLFIAVAIPIYSLSHLVIQSAARIIITLTLWTVH